MNTIVGISFLQIKQKIIDSRALQIFIIIFLNILLYLPYIIALPDHYLDDYVLFGIIHSNSSNPVSLNAGDPYFLFMRPVSYFSFWIDYHLFYMMPFMMKLVSLLLHLLLICGIYYLFVEFKTYFNLKVNNFWLLLVTLIYSCYPDNFKWMIWISNRTELLMILFYVLSLLYALKYLNNPNYKFNYLLIHFFFFLLSIASKQQSLHLPFLFIFFILYKKRDTVDNHRKVLNTLLVIEILIVAVFIMINFNLHTNESDIFLLSLWKKPFSLFGNLLIVINPYYGELVYTYFVMNKLYAVIIAIIGVIFLYLLIKRFKAINSFLLILITYLIISFPRLFVYAGSRINSIQVLFLFTVLFGLLAVYKEKMVKTFFLIFFILNLGTIYKIYKTEKIFNQSYTKRIDQLASIYDDNTFIISLKDPLMISYQYNYFIKNEYGKSKLNFTPILFSELMSPEYGNSFPRIEVFLEDNVVTIKAMNDFVFLSINPGESPDYLFNPMQLKTENGISGRGFSKITFDIPFEMKNKKLIYHNGIEWCTVSKF